MKTIEIETLLHALKWRYATKQFDPSKKIPPHLWEALEDALVLAPSSFGLQPWKFIVVEDPAVRAELVKVSWGQKQIADACHLVVFAVQHPIDATHVRRFIEHTAKVQDTPVEKLAGYEKIITGFVENPPFGLEVRSWSTRQVYIALGNFMTAAALLGIDTCPMEGLDPAAYDKILGLEGTGYYTVAACPAGYRAESDHSAARPKVRYHKDDVIRHI